MREMREMSGNTESNDRTYYAIVRFMNGILAVELEDTGGEPDVWRDIEAFDARAKTSLRNVFDEDDILDIVDDIDSTRYDIDHMVHDWDSCCLLAVFEYPSEVRRLWKSIPRHDTSGVGFDHVARGGCIMSEDVEHAGLRYRIEYRSDDDGPDFESDDIDWYIDHVVRISVYPVVRWSESRARAGAEPKPLTYKEVREMSEKEMEEMNGTETNEENETFTDGDGRVWHNVETLYLADALMLDDMLRGESAEWFETCLAEGYDFEQATKHVADEAYAAVVREYNTAVGLVFDEGLQVVAEVCMKHPMFLRICWEDIARMLLADNGYEARRNERTANGE